MTLQDENCFVSSMYDCYIFYTFANDDDTAFSMKRWWHWYHSINYENCVFLWFKTHRSNVFAHAEGPLFCSQKGHKRVHVGLIHHSCLPPLERLNKLNKTSFQMCPSTKGVHRHGDQTGAMDGCKLRASKTGRFLANLPQCWDDCQEMTIMKSLQETIHLNVKQWFPADVFFNQSTEKRQRRALQNIQAGLPQVWSFPLPQ